MKVAFAPLYDSNPYQELLMDSLSEDVDFADLGDFEPRHLVMETLKNELDVLHLHWADFYYRDSMFKTLAKFFLFHINLLIIRIFGPKIVWTMHNDRQHENNYPKIDYVTRVLIGIFASKITVWDENTEEIAAKKFSIPRKKLEIVPHGNYLPIIENYNIPNKEEAREKLNITTDYEHVYLFAGLIRPYKQVPLLIDTFKEISDESELLIVAGNPHTEEIKQEILSKTEETENIETELQYISEQKLINYYKATDWAVFPYKHIFNSGSIFYAMSLSTPVIAPKKGSIVSFSDTENVLFNELKEGLTCAKAVNAEFIGKNNLELMYRKYNWRMVSQRHIEVYGEK